MAIGHSAFRESSARLQSPEIVVLRKRALRIQMENMRMILMIWAGLQHCPKLSSVVEEEVVPSSRQTYGLDDLSPRAAVLTWVQEVIMFCNGQDLIDEHSDLWLFDQRLLQD